MKKITSVFLFAILSLISISNISAKELTEENSINSAKSQKTAFKTVRGKFAESASKSGKANLLQFYRGSQSRGNYKVVASILRRTIGIDRYNLPQPKYTWSYMMPTAVFFANADNDSDNEILIIERNMTGIGPDGSKSFYRTRVYDWNGKTFKHLEKISETIGTARTEARVKLILEKMLNETVYPKYEELNTALFNRNVRIAAKQKEFWVKMPTLVASNFVGKFSEAKTRTVQIISPSAEFSRTLDVIIIDDGLADDSVRSEKYKLKLRNIEEDIWYVISAEKAQRCYKGRGHQDYSAVPCM